MTPASRTALLLGRVLRDVVVLLVQGALLAPARSRCLNWGGCDAGYPLE